MTPTEKKVLDSIQAGYMRHQDIADALGMSLGSINFHMANLRKKGLLERTRKKRIQHIEEKPPLEEPLIKLCQLMSYALEYAESAGKPASTIDVWQLLKVAREESMCTANHYEIEVIQD